MVIWIEKGSRYSAFHGSTKHYPAGNPVKLLDYNHDDIHSIRFQEHHLVSSYFPPNHEENQLLPLAAPSSTLRSNSSIFFSASALACLAKFSASWAVLDSSLLTVET